MACRGCERRGVVNLSVVDDVRMVRGVVAGDVEALAEIWPGVLVDRRMPHDLVAKRQIADVVLADLERELVGLGPGEELRRDGEGVLDQMGRHAVVGDDEKPGVLPNAGNGARERCCGAGITGEVWPDVAAARR
jgi:hypothetical protein